MCLNQPQLASISVDHVACSRTGIIIDLGCYVTGWQKVAYLPMSFDRPGPTLALH